MKKILVAGATGTLGKFLLYKLKNMGYETIALARNTRKLEGIPTDGIIKAEVTQPITLDGKFSGVDCVISTVGITRQKDGLTYMDVDYEANVNLLNEAVYAGVKKFIYVSVLNGQYMKELKMVAAKERFVNELESSCIDYVIIRPNGFFTDFIEVLDMARKGKVYLLGNGQYKGNPIHGADLAEFIVNHLDDSQVELEVGGPDVLTHNEMAELAFQAIGKAPKISHIPDWIRKSTLSLTRLFNGQKTYGPIEFFMTVMARDMIAPQFGNHHLDDFFKVRYLHKNLLKEKNRYLFGTKRLKRRREMYV